MRHLEVDSLKTNRIVIKSKSSPKNIAIGVAVLVGWIIILFTPFVLYLIFRFTWALITFIVLAILTIIAGVTNTIYEYFMTKDK